MMFGPETLEEPRLPELELLLPVKATVKYLLRSVVILSGRKEVHEHRFPSFQYRVSVIWLTAFDGFQGSFPSFQGTWK